MARTIYSELSWDIPDLGQASDFITKEATIEIPIEHGVWHYHDAITALPSTAANDDLGLNVGTFAVGQYTKYLDSGTVAIGNTATRKARTCIVLPRHYVAAGAATIRVQGLFVDSLPPVAKTVDIEAYLVSASTHKLATPDLVSPAAQSMTLTLASYDFSLTTTNLVPGSLLDTRITIDINNTGGDEGSTAYITRVQLICDTKGYQ